MSKREGVEERYVDFGDGFELAIDRAESMAEVIGVLVLRARREVDIIDAFKYLTHAIPMAYILARDRQVKEIFGAIRAEASSIVSDSLGTEVQLDPDPLECLRRVYREVRDALKNANYPDFRVSMEKLAWCLSFISAAAMAKRGQGRQVPWYQHQGQ
ncbi:MAG: hypothetical protein RQ842_09990 [Vulcanisaeta sp.]|jgi:hypothetical protein|nr:hypothetical protein [Vulcanisaeta sp.]